MSSPTLEPAGDWTSRSHPVPEDMRLQRATWRFERYGWIGLCAVIVLAVLGLFGNGPLSSATATTSNGQLQVEYGRFERNGAATDMRLHVAAPSAQRPEIRIGNAFLDAFTIEAVTPQPAEQRSGPDGVEMAFEAEDSGPVHVYFSLRPEAVGLVKSEIALAGGAPARFTQFIYP
jgi:hypothetical protein